MKYDKAMELVKALRSGKYKQDKRRLKTKDGFCCLGVACEISKLGKFNSDNDYLINTNPIRGCLPKEVMEYFGFKNNMGSFTFIDPDTKQRKHCDLASLNDGDYEEQWNFKQIADVIETHWKEL